MTTTEKLCKAVQDLSEPVITVRYEDNDATNRSAAHYNSRNRS